MFSTTILTSLLLSLSTIHSATAGPVFGREAQYPEVIPGPGLPSLESLGLTSAQLYEMPVPSASDLTNLGFSKRNGVPECGPQEEAYTNVNGIIACYNYLNSLGHTDCAVNGPKPVEMCRSGDAHATGQSWSGNYASSWCSDVAIGLLWVINSCTRPDQSCAGAQAPNGNGNFFVMGSNVRW